MRLGADRLFLITGGTQGFAFAWGLPAIVWWVEELALSPIEMVLLGTALVVTILLAEVPTGVVADLYSRKRSVVAAYTVMGIAMMLSPVTEVFAVLAVWQVLWGVGWTLQSGAATAWVTDELASRGSRDPAAAAAATIDQLIVRHAMCRSVGVMAGLVVASAAGFWSVRGSMALMGVLTLAIAAFLAVAMAETGFVPTRGRGGAGSAARIRGAGLWRDAVEVSGRGARLVRRNPTLLAVVTAAGVAGAASHAVEWLDVLRLLQIGLTGYDGGETVVFFGAVWFVMAGLAIPVMWWLARRIGSAPPEMHGSPRGHLRRANDAILLARLLVVVGLGTLALAVSPWFAVALGGWTVLDVAGETTYPLAEAMANRNAPSQVRATVISFLGQAEAVGQVTGGLILGVVAQVLSVTVALTIAAALFGVSAVPVALAGRRADLG